MEEGIRRRGCRKSEKKAEEGKRNKRKGQTDAFSLKRVVLTRVVHLHLHGCLKSRAVVSLLFYLFPFCLCLFFVGLMGKKVGQLRWKGLLG